MAVSRECWWSKSVLSRSKRTALPFWVKGCSIFTGKSDRDEDFGIGA